jgi:ribosomal protein S18 acetylase RimI-like enzyme
VVQEQGQSLIRKHLLTGTELTEIEQLMDICNKYEDLHMRFNWLRPPPLSEEINDFLYYEDGKLAGYLNISSYGTSEKELLGMVHPEHRRNGIFRTLLMAAREECMRRSVQKLILVCEHASCSGLAFAAAIGAHYDFSEHAMVLGDFQERRTVDEGVHVREAGAANFEALVSIMATDLGDTREAKFYVTQFLQRPGQRFYLGMLNEESIGCLRLDEIENEVGIYGFVVRPEYRGRGCGMQILEAAIRTIRAEGDKRIALEVETNNTNAIGLYRSCGFQVMTTYDYYSLDT